MYGEGESNGRKRKKGMMKGIWGKQLKLTAI